MHSVFLYHAISAGMDMAIVNAGALVLYEDIEPRAIQILEDAILNRGGEVSDKIAMSNFQGNRKALRICRRDQKSES